MSGHAARIEPAERMLPAFAHRAPTEFDLDIPDLTLGGLLRHAADTVPGRTAPVDDIADPATCRRWT